MTSEEDSGITIRHTRTDGTVVEGTTRADGTGALLGGMEGAGLRFDRDNERWYVRYSRRRSADSPLVEYLAVLLREAGHPVRVDVDNTTPAGPFAEYEAERSSRARARTAAREEWAARAQARSDASHHRASAISERFQGGQPVLIGHHSEKSARRDHQRIDAAQDKAREEARRAAHHEERAAAVQRRQEQRADVGTTLRRIEGLEKRLREIGRSLTGAAPQGAAVLRAEQAETADELDYWRQQVQAAEDQGVKLWSRADFRPGDYARAYDRWFEIKRVNGKSVTVASIMDERPVVTLAGSRLSWTDTVPYAKVSGRMSAEEMQARLRKE